jgi:hypothetical protein
MLVYNDVTVSTSLLMLVRITFVFVKSVFSSCGSFNNGTKTANKFYVQLKKTAIKKFEMLTSVDGEECLSRMA